MSNNTINLIVKNKSTLKLIVHMILGGWMLAAFFIMFTEHRYILSIFCLISSVANGYEVIKAK